MKAKPTFSWSRTALIIAAATVVILAGTFLFFRQRLPAGIMKDIRAGIAAKDISDPDQRVKKYLELRYGSMESPANRQKAFIDFFDIEHIKALQLMVSHAPKGRGQESIQAMSRWVETYRESLTLSEREQLREQLGSPQGRAMLQWATAQYNSQSVEYRGQTAPVISQLLKTVYAVQNP